MSSEEEEDKYENVCQIVYSKGSQHQRAVAISLHSQRSQAVKEFWIISSQILLASLNGKPLNIDQLFSIGINKKILR